MIAWTDDELDKIGTADEIQIAPRRRDGGRDGALRRRVIIWVVRVGADLYVRSYKGRSAHWYQGVQESHAGRIWAGGVEKDIVFVDEAGPAVNDKIDAAYLAKYGHTPYARPMLAPEVRATTIKLVPNLPGA